MVQHACESSTILCITLVPAPVITALSAQGMRVERCSIPRSSHS